MLNEKLWHLGFHYMQKLYPNLCNTLDFSRLKSEICELTKNQRVSYLISGKKKSEIFFLVIHIFLLLDGSLVSLMTLVDYLGLFTEEQICKYCHNSEFLFNGLNII